MKTIKIICDHCGTDIQKHEGIDMVFGEIPIAGITVNLQVGPPSEFQFKKRRDFCNEGCLRDYLNNHLPPSDASQPKAV